MLRYADISGRVPEHRRAKGLENSGVFPRGARGQRGDSRRGLVGKFAGILQVEIR
jgi:hypothetical protein